MVSQLPRTEGDFGGIEVTTGVYLLWLPFLTIIALLALLALLIWYWCYKK